MKPVQFKEQNVIYIKPDGMTDEQCSSLHAFKGGDGNIVSCWEPSKEDIKRIKAGGKVWLTVKGISQPPVHLSTHTPFEE